MVNQREVGVGHEELRQRAQVRAAAGPGRHPDRRDARPRDDRRPRSPPPRPGTSSSPRCTRRTRRRRSTASSTSFPPHQQQQVRIQLAGTPARYNQSAASADDRREEHESSRPRCSCRRPAIRNLIREAKTHQMHDGDADRAPVRHGDAWTSRSPTCTGAGLITLDAALSARDGPAVRVAAQASTRPAHDGSCDDGAVRSARAWPPSRTRSATRPARSSRARLEGDSRDAVSAKLRQMGYIILEPRGGAAALRASRRQGQVRRPGSSPRTSRSSRVSSRR